MSSISEPSPLIDSNMDTQSISEPPPPANPLFVKQGSDGSTALFGELLKYAGYPASSNVNTDHSALHQLATSSSTYSTLSRVSPRSGAFPQQSHQPYTSSPYRFDPMRALHSAVQMAAATCPSLDTTMEESDLGLPPTTSPALNIQHSLMGGGIESQPVVMANVSTRNFEWTKGDERRRLRSESLPNIFLSQQETNTPLWKEI